MTREASSSHSEAALYEAFATSGKALANGRRLELLDLPSQGERPVEALARAAGLHLTTASAHLFARVREVAEAHQAAVPRARDACPGAADRAQPAADDLADRVRSGEVVVLGVRPAEAYAAGPIRGARPAPITELVQRIHELADATEIFVYCRDVYRAPAHGAVRLLTECGRRAVRLSDGMLEWRLSERPVAASAT